MGSKDRICATVALAALLVCAAQKAAAAPVNCGNSGACNIDVHVENCVITAPDLDVFAATNIFWNIDQASKQAGYKYPPDPRSGVWIKDGDPGTFDSPQRLNDWKFKLHDKNSPKGTFHYGVRVVKDSTACPDLDPSIVNH